VEMEEGRIVVRPVEDAGGRGNGAVAGGSAGAGDGQESQEGQGAEGAGAAGAAGGTPAAGTPEAAPSRRRRGFGLPSLPSFRRRKKGGP
jgi:hypothetical protein